VARGYFKPHKKAEYIAAILNLVGLNKKSLAIGAGPYIVKWLNNGMDPLLNKKASIKSQDNLL